MFALPLATSTTPLAAHQFWEAVLIYFERPHLVNRKLLTAIPCLFYEIDLYKNSISEIFSKHALLYESRCLKAIRREFIDVELLHNLIEPFDKNYQLIACNLNDFKARSDGVFVSVRILLPKSNSDCLEIVVLNKNDNSAFIVAAIEPSLKSTEMCAPPFGYTLKLDKDGFKLIVDSVEDADTSQAEWLTSKLFPKILNWTNNNNVLSPQTVESLSQIDSVAYFEKYLSLKSKYGKFLVDNWPSGTDPQKYVFEDIAIASYLIVLFEMHSFGAKNVNFVDCGCGNGLLVYLLNKEGFKGFGVDIRRRKVWDIYGDLSKNLKEGLIDSQSVFKECNWIIGNHSDELTPWLPIIARKSNDKCHFFVLPCCPFDLNGRKYIRKNTAVSTYSDYLNYIENLSLKCGFDVQMDKLRIPSTKRTCLIGIAKKSDSNSEYFLKSIIENKEISFKYREKQEKVRNCTQLDKKFVFAFIKSIVDVLLSIEPSIVVNKIPNRAETWKKGGEIRLTDLPSKLDREDLRKLKNECGGLQTMLKNHRYLFDLSNGTVKLRLPLERSDNTEKYRNKPCWYYFNHPDGCLFANDVDCAYKHS